MFSNHYRLILIILILAALINIASPWTSLDLLAIFLAVIVSGQILFKEKMLLFFLAVRPALDYWRDWTFFQYQNYTLNINGAFALLFLVWAIWTAIPYLKKISRSWLLATTLIISALMLGSAFYSVSFTTSIIEAVKFINLIFLFWLAYVFIQENIINKKQLLITLALGSIIPLTLAISQLFMGAGLDTFGLHGRIYGTFGHPNVLAFYLLFLIFILIQYGFLQKNEFWKNRQFTLYTLGLLLFALLAFTYTRAAWAGLLIFLIVLSVFGYKKILYYLLAGLALFYLIFYPFNNWLKNSLDYNLQENQLISRLTTRDEDADSLAWRLVLFQETTPLIFAHPYLGYGYGTFPLVWEDNRGLQHLWDDSAEAHNDYLKIVFEIGALGLIIYLILLLQLAWQGLKLTLNNSQEYLYFFAWVVAFIAISLSDNMLHHTPVMFLLWSWWGAMLGEKQIKDSR